MLKMENSERERNSTPELIMTRTADRGERSRLRGDKRDPSH